MSIKYSHHKCRLKRLGRTVCLMALIVLPTASLWAETPEERLLRLENEIKELREIMRNLPNEQAPMPTESEVPTREPASVVARTKHGVSLRYFVHRAPIDPDALERVEPIVEGRFQGMDSLSFDPAEYDVPDSGFLSGYRDAVTNPHVAIAVAGQLSLDEPGEYEFVVYPKPAKQGGSAVGSRMDVRMRVDGDVVIDSKGTTSWRPLRGQLVLAPGWHKIELWAMASYAGAGPGPTESSIGLALRGPGDATPRSMEGLMTPN